LGGDFLYAWNRKSPPIAQFDSREIIDALSALEVIMRPATSWVLLTLLVGLCCGFASAQAGYSVLYAFGTKGGTNDGWSPNGGLVFDAVGNMYGTTGVGGGVISALCPYGCGTVFELSPVAGGGWTETLLHVFSDSQDGLNPSSGLVFDAHGNLYGTTLGDGSEGCQGTDCGTVFELSPEPNGAWTETVLYSFKGRPDGQGPVGPVVFDVSGNLYATTNTGGPNDYGTVFELSPPSFPGGDWTESVLYDFCQVGGLQECSDGASPSAGVVLDSFGNLYGTAAIGGRARFWGLAYELSPNSGGTWTETVLYEFNQKNGGTPEAGLSFDAFGNLYGTLEYGGLKAAHCFQETFPPYSRACGGAFRLTPKAGGGWSELSFLFNGNDGGNPLARLVLDGATLYGTTYQGGYGYGTVFRITGTDETVLYKFCHGLPPCADGGGPWGITLNGGRLYGVTEAGGAYSQGVVFSIAP
jgi:uncharacterized repeat protein (TIGR03803 family)